MEHSLYRPMLASCITVSSYLVGCQLSLSHVSAAALLNTPNITEEAALNQFSTIFRRGLHLCPPAAFFSGLTCYANAALSYYYYYRGGDGRSEIVAARPEIVPRLLLTGTLMIGIVPFTLTWIVPVEEPLLHRNKTFANKKHCARHEMMPREYGDERGTEAERVRKEKEARERDQTLEQVRRWNHLNYIRVFFPAAGVISAWYLCW
ncbi:hypothetical protein PG995_012262 [Apiospora arundinis]